MGNRGRAGAAIRIGIVDNDPCSLQMIAMLTTHASPRFTVVWRTTNAHHALEHCLFDSSREKINLILLDMALNEISGVDVCQRIRKRDGNIGILGITAYPAAHYRTECAKAGAQGLMEKKELSNTKLLIDNITQAAQGLPYDSQSDFQTASNAHRSMTQQRHVQILSYQELNIIRLYAMHQSTAAIAKQLGITEGTVFSHVYHAMQKLGVNSRNEVIQACKAVHLI